MRKTVLLFFLIFSLLAGCTNTSDNSINDDIVKLLEHNNENLKVIYDRHLQKMLLYNEKNLCIEKKSNSPNYFQYEFNSANNNYFSSGNSITNQFEILFNDGHKIHTLLKLEDQKNQAIFPLAISSDYKIFMQLFYDQNGKEINRSLVSLTKENKLIGYPKVNGLFSSGAILSNNLFLTVLDEKSQSYSLYQLDLSNFYNSAKLIEENLAQPELYVHNEKLYRADKKNIYNGNDSFTKAELNYFEDKYNVLIQINPSKDGPLELNVINVNSKKIIYSVKDVIDFSIQNNNLKVYCNKSIENYSFNDTK